MHIMSVLVVLGCSRRHTTKILSWPTE